MDMQTRPDQRTPTVPAHLWSIAALAIAAAGLMASFGPPATSMLGAGFGTAGAILGGFSYARRHDGQGVALISAIVGTLSVPVGVWNLTVGYLTLF